MSGTFMVIHLNQDPVAPQDHFSVQTLLGQSGIYNVYLTCWKGIGLPLGADGIQLPIFLRLRNQCDLPVWGNVNRGCMITFDAAGNNPDLPSLGKPISAKQKWNDSYRLELELVDTNGDAFDFTDLWLEFRFDLTFDPTQTRLTNHDLTLMQG